MKGVVGAVAVLIGVTIVYAVITGVGTTGWSTGVIALVVLLPLILIAVAIMRMLGGLGSGE